MAIAGGATPTDGLAGGATRDRASGYLIELPGDPMTIASADWDIDRRTGSAGSIERTAALAARAAALRIEHEHAAARIRAIAPTARIASRYVVAWNGLHVVAAAPDAHALRAAGFDLRPNSRVEAFLNKSVPQVRADRVWNRIGASGNPLDGRDVSIAILDSGVDFTHLDLGGCLGDGCKVAGGWDVVNDDANPMDDHGHGTHVASVAAGNGLFRGVAPGATIRAYKVMGSDATGNVADVLTGLELAVDPDRDGDTRDGADIINISLGCTTWGECTPDDPLARAVDNVVADGFAVVAAAGNAGWAGIASPASARRAVAVGAAEGVTGTASFSSEGPVSWDDQLMGKPDLVAPGVGICAARRPGFAPGAVCHFSGKHVRMSGSSMAAAHVSGAAAILLSARPDLTPEQVKNLLRAYARPIPEFNNSGSALGAGVLDVEAAVDGAGAPGTAVPTVSLEPISAVHWPRVVRASVAASNLARWRLEAGGLHLPTWSLLAEGTQAPAGDVFHVFTQPLYWDVGPRLRLTVETVDGRKAVDYSWVPSHAEHITPLVGAAATGVAHNGWSNGARALYSDNQHAEAADDPAKRHVAFSFSTDAGSTWLPVAGAVVLPDDVDGRVAEIAALDVPGIGFQAASFRLRIHSASGALTQDFSEFDLRVPPDAHVTKLQVHVEGHNRWTRDPVLGQALGVTRRIDEVAVRVRYRLQTASSTAPLSATFSDMDAAPSCLIGCHSDPHVAVRNDGRPVVAYRDIAQNSLKLMICGDVDCRNGNLQTQVDGAPGCAPGCGVDRGGFHSVSLALRSDNRPVIAYVAETASATQLGSRDLWIVSCGDALCRTGNTYRKFDMSQFSPPPPDSCVLIICQPGPAPPAHSHVGTATLALPSTGGPIIALAARIPQAEDTVVRVLTCATADCSGDVTATTLEGPGCLGACDAKSEVVWPIALTFRPDGRPIVSYQQQYVWTGAQKSSVDRIKVITCGNRTCTTGNTTTVVTPHTGYAPVVRLQATGLPTVTFLGGSIPQPLMVTCRTAICSGPVGASLLEDAIALDGWGACAPGCNPRTSHGFRQATVLGASGAPILAVQDQHAGSLKVIRCADLQCAHGTTYHQIDGATGCPSGCNPASVTGVSPSMARRPSDGALVMAYRDTTREVLRVAVVRF